MVTRRERDGRHLGIMKGSVVTDRGNLRFATDLVTFYNPAYWGGEGDLDSIGGLFSWGDWTPERFWTRVLDDVREAGLDGIEMTFAPGNWLSALEAFGTAEAFADQVHKRGLAVASGFLSNFVDGGKRQLELTNPDDHERYEEVVGDYAAFLQACGCDLIVATLPLRRDRTAEPPLFFDLEAARTAADGLHRAAYAAAKHGVGLALHPEAFTMFRNARDVDLMMALLDPTYVNLCPDTAQFTVAGSDPIAIAERHKDRVVLTHWKDATGPAPDDVHIDETIFARQVQWFAEVGQGVVDWPAWMRLLREIDYRGWAVFELDATPDPVGDLTSIRAYVERNLGHIYR
jgi:sugar phosphate isomerase/epimerase